MDLCVGIASFAPWIRKEEISLEAAAILCNENEFHAIEPCDRSIRKATSDELRRFRSICDRNELAVPCLDIRNDFTVKDRDEWERNVKHVKRWISVANELEIPVARIWTGDRSCDHSAVSRFHRAIEAVLPYAESSNIRLAIENHGGISANADILLETVTKFDSKHLGICIDFGNWAVDDRYDGISLLLPWAFHIHAKSYLFAEDGKEDQIDYHRIFSLLTNGLKRIPYVSIEFEGPVQAIADNIEGIRKTRELINSCVFLNS